MKICLLYGYNSDKFGWAGTLNGYIYLLIYNTLQAMSDISREKANK